MRFVTSRLGGPLLTLIGFALALVVIGAIGSSDNTSGGSATLPGGRDSTLAAQARDKLGDTGGQQAIIIWSADQKLTPDQLGAIRAALPKGASQAIPSEDGTAVFSVLEVEASESAALGNAVQQLRESVRGSAPPGVQVAVTGPAGIQADIANVFDGANFTLLGATVLVVAVLLILTYRSPVLWLLPLMVVGLADQLAAVTATRVLDALGLAYDGSTTGILSVLVFGAGTNYALLLISRYRDELKVRQDRREALAIAGTRVRESIISAAGTVIAGVLCLLLSSFPGTRALGVACAVGVAIAALYGLVVLPAFLSLFGRWVFWPRVPRTDDPTPSPAVRGVWRRIAEAVAARPGQTIAAVLALMAVLAVGLSQISIGLKTTEQFTKTPESIAAGDRLAKSFGAGAVEPTLVTLRPADLGPATAALKQVPGVTQVRPGQANAEVATLQVVLTTGSDDPGTPDTIRALRDRASQFSDMHVGGSAAEALDASEAATADRWKIFPAVLALVLVSMMVLLRSVVAPVLLVVTVVLNYGAALGAAWWITRLLGFSAYDVLTPLYSFLFLVALGVDYNIFVISRATEEIAQRGHVAGMVRAVGVTGGVITSAGIVLAAVFAVLGVLPLVVLAQIGVVICLGVLLDTFVVRSMLVPAIAMTLKDAFWWPRKVSS